MIHLPLLICLIGIFVCLMVLKLLIIKLKS